MRIKSVAGSMIMASAVLLSPSGPASADDLCTRVSKVAMVVMEARQKGEPMAGMMMVAEAQDDLFRGLTRDLVVIAYDSDRRFSEEARRREIVEFGNNAYKACLRTSG